MWILGYSSLFVLVGLAIFACGYNLGYAESKKSIPRPPGKTAAEIIASHKKRH